MCECVYEYIYVCVCVRYFSVLMLVKVCKGLDLRQMKSRKWH